jgi:diguanylate cyclase (GGDEF)-like protein
VLRLLRILGLLAPVAVAVRFLILPQMPLAAVGFANSIFLVELLSVVAGIGVTCLLVSLVLGTRIDRLARAADRIARGDLEIRVPVSRDASVARLDMAINAIAEQLAATHDAATTDTLTRIPNRATIQDALTEEVSRANRFGRPLSVAFLDIDHFKSINDTWEHHAGDIVLRRVAHLLRTNVRSIDHIGRWGGEEFVLVLPETDVDEAAALAEKLRMLVMREPIDIEQGEPVTVTISAGVAGGLGQQMRVEELVRHADTAMLSAKGLGRNQVFVFAETTEESRVPRAPISAEGRASALELGRAARVAAEQMLHSVMEPQPHYRGRPSELIAVIATTMAGHLALPQAEIDRIRVASLLHDVGKVAIPEEILDKPAPLTGAEWQSVVQHPRIGQLILEQAGSLRDAVPIILHHHERFGGSGYPYGLRGQDIPLGARIVAVADAYDAMMHDRPYKAAVGHVAAVSELRRHAGMQFDPALVELFCDLFVRGVHGFEYVGEHLAGAHDLGGSRPTRRASPGRRGSAAG